MAEDSNPGVRTRLLRDHPAFRRYWLARVASVVGDGAAEAALLLYAAGLRHGGRSVGLVLLATSVPRFFGPLLGAIADRFDRRTVLICADLGQAVGYGVIAITLPPLPLLLALVSVSAVFATTFGVAARAAVPGLLAPTLWTRGNALLGLARNLQVVFGPAIGGILTGVAGTRWALAFNAATFLGSAVLLAGVPKLPAGERGAGMHGFVTDTREGLRYAFGHPTIRAVTILLLAGVAFAALDNLALVFLARGPLQAGPVGYGVLAGSFGVGMVAASITVLRIADRVRPGAAVVTGWVLSGAGLLATGLMPVIALAVLTQLVGGAGNGLANIAEETLLQQSVEPEYLGRVGGLLTSAAFLGSSIAYAAGGFFVEAASPRTVLVVAGCGVLLVCLLVQGALRKAVAQVNSA